MKRLFEAGFRAIAIPPYDNALCVQKGECGAVLAPVPQGGLKLLAPPTYLVDGKLSVKLKRGAGDVFVWKGREVEATSQKLRELETFRQELSGILELPQTQPAAGIATRLQSRETQNLMNTYDLICIGAGPTGLATAIEARRAGMRPLVIDKGCLCNSLYHYPVNMVFFTTPELLEIGDLPMVCAAEKPTRLEALKYYRKAAEHFELELKLYECVLHVDGHDGHFTVVTETERGVRERYRGKKLAVATGYYDLPNLLGVPGEDLPHVSHYYTEPHAFWNEDVVVIGGKNSAAEAALDLYRSRARVTLVHRGKNFSPTIKYWVRPDLENRIKAGQIQALLNTRVEEIKGDEVLVESQARTKRIPAKQVFALTGYHPDYAFMESLGVKLDPESKKPVLDPNTLESNVPGIHLGGVVIGGRHTGEIFIENGRFHGKQIIEALKK